MASPTNNELAFFSLAEFEAYIDEGIWQLEQFLARHSRWMTHLGYVFEDSPEE